MEIKFERKMSTEVIVEMAEQCYGKLGMFAEALEHCLPAALEIEVLLQAKVECARWRLLKYYINVATKNVDDVQPEDIIRMRVEEFLFGKFSMELIRSPPVCDGDLDMVEDGDLREFLSRRSSVDDSVIIEDFYDECQSGRCVRHITQDMTDAKIRRYFDTLKVLYCAVADEDDIPTAFFAETGTDEVFNFDRYENIMLNVVHIIKRKHLVQW